MAPTGAASLRDKCFHPTGTFIEFRKQDLEQSIPERFQEQVRLFPNRVAVKTEDHELTYDALNQESNRIARAVLAACGEAKEPVALLFEQSAQVVSAILGVLKAGKFYVSLDPSYPRIRTSYMLENSQAGAIVTNNRNLSLAKQLANQRCQLLNIDALVQALHLRTPSCLLHQMTLPTSSTPLARPGSPKESWRITGTCFIRA